MSHSSQKSPQTPCAAPIAVVGLGCRYPGADTPRELWECVLARRRAFRRLGDQRLPLEDYHDPDPSAPNRIYSTRAALLADFEFDWAARRIPRATFRSTDTTHWLALETALDAVADAGEAFGRADRARTGVVVGNSLTGEGPRNVAVQTRWPFFEHLLRASAAATGLDRREQQQLVNETFERFREALGEVDEDTLAGTLSNTIAGRICNYLDLHGGGYVVDGACASSLLAVITAARALASGELDLVLAGGVDVSLDPYELVGFAKAGALSPDQMRVYDARANGFIPGEGAGFVVLQRLEDARAQGARVYALLTGWGVSSDGRGGITAPTVAGQALAIRRAHQNAAQLPHFVEGHGTGTPLGDRVELEALQAAFGAVRARSVGVTSLKSVVGHTKAAAGVGGFIKAVMAVNRRVLPPTAACAEPSSTFERAATTLYPLRRGARLPADAHVCAGVSAMGFGGINSHVRVEACDPPDERLASAHSEERLCASAQDAELFVVSADTPTQLGRRLREVARLARDASEAELCDLSAELAARAAPDQPCRAAVVASLPDELERACDALAGVGDGAALGAALALREDTPKRARVSFVFPGQGSQMPGMGWSLVARFDWARERFDRGAQVARRVVGLDLAELLLADPDRVADAPAQAQHRARLRDTRAAQPAIALVSALWLERLRAFGVEPQLVAGHSLGELTALHAAGAFDLEQLVELAGLRGLRIAEHAQPGAMASLGCDDSAARALLAGLEQAWTPTSTARARPSWAGPRTPSDGCSSAPPRQASSLSGSRSRTLSTLRWWSPRRRSCAPTSSAWDSAACRWRSRSPAPSRIGRRNSRPSTFLSTWVRS